ncbi:TIR domain-containing protein [Amycolatopsis sulphurea]|uniref:TIR domain-containing protein n=1 Tax=Amycolatopsis sulphurea TaxID=76022 RepID=A0A2A9FCT0_9PSEU|nr:toll/interleukin-1 receptor domain-containing protein [Amycolatopsis sulphurea]PFG48239.1 TIR domain-containing protein [Amycolatopsis sulphurea]
MPDVFISYDRTDAPMVERLGERLVNAGLEVFLDTEAIRPFESISDRVRRSLAASSTLLAYYSRSYGSRRACQEEFTTAWLAGAEHVLVVNPEPGIEHLAPREILDYLLPGHPATEYALTRLVDAVRARLAAVPDVIGLEPEPQRLVSAPTKFTGRWTELWQLHSVLHNGGIAVVHGVHDSGKTTLAHAYVQQFGRAYGRIFVGDAMAAVPGDLVVLDDVNELPGKLPRGVACLLLTRDAHLAEYGIGIELTDLREDELDLDLALREAAEGSVGLAVRLAEQFSGSPESVLDRLYQLESPLLDPLTERIPPAVSRLGEEAWDVARILAAVAPVPLTWKVLAEVLFEAGGPGAAELFTSTNDRIEELLATGVLISDNVGELVLPRAFALALRKAEPRPARAEQLREITLRLLTKRARPRQAVVPVRRRSELDEQERKAAHRILNELTSRTAIQPPPEDHSGLLRAALSSLHELIDRLRLITDQVDQDALRPSTRIRPGLSTVIGHLREGLLRPFLTKWHPALDNYYDLQPPGVGRFDHERNWDRYAELQTDFGKLRSSISEVADELTVLSGNPLR